MCDQECEAELFKNKNVTYKRTGRCNNLGSFMVHLKNYLLFRVEEER